MSDKRIFPDRNCPTCRGTGVRNCSGSIIYDEYGKVRSSSCATTPCHCVRRVPAPAVPDDVAARLDEAVTIIAKIVIALGLPADIGTDRLLDAIEAQAAELARLTRINSELVKSHNALNLDGARLEDRLATAEDDNRNLRAALERCLNFIDNTECELGMTLECGDIARAALNPTGDRTNGL